jgi:hypothetical protein
MALQALMIALPASTFSAKIFPPIVCHGREAIPACGVIVREFGGMSVFFCE